MRLSATAVAFAAALPYAFAQTSTDCDPLEKTCPNDTGLNSKSFSADFTSDGGLDSWTEAVATNIELGDQGAEFSISDGKDAPTVETEYVSNRVTRSFMRLTWDTASTSSSDA